jgi:predicted phage-related endonuclease
MGLSEKQRQMRRTGYGASEVAALVGVGPGSPIEIYAEKVLGPEKEVDPSLAARLGQVLEAGVADVYAEITGCWLLPMTTVRHPSRKLALCTPDRARFISHASWAEACKRMHDGLIGLDAIEEADRLVQVKTTAARFRREYGPEGTDEIPMEKVIQVTWEMGVCNQALCDVPVLFRGDWGVDLGIYTVAFDQGLFESLYAEVERFHCDHVMKREPPPADASSSYDDFLARAYPAVKRAQIFTASPAEEALLYDWAKVLACEARIKVLKKELRQKLEAAIGEFEGMESDAIGKVTWRRTKDTTKVDWQRAAHEFQTLAAQCLNAFDVLAQTGEQLSPENRAKLEQRLREIIPNATATKPGYRRLNANPKLRKLFDGVEVEGAAELLAAGDGAVEDEEQSNQ